MADLLHLCPHCGEFKESYSKARRTNFRCIDCQAKHRAEVAMRKAKNNKAARDRFTLKKQQRIRDEKRAAKAAAAAAKVAPTPAEQEAAMFAANATAEEKTARAAQAELARRELARRSLLDFILYFEPDYDAGWVHQEICARLEQFVEDILAGRSPHLIICMPPRHGKSMIASEYLPAWFLGRHSRKEVIACSYAGSLANQFSRRVQDILREPAYQAIFPGVTLAKGAESVEEWATAINGNKCRRGGYRSAGVGGPITGKGADLFIVDDPVKNREEAESAVDRLSKKNWFTSTAYTRLMPGGGMLIILTRWHDDDLAGWQLAQYREALAEMTNTGVLPEGTIEWDEINYPAIAIADEENRKKGEALHPSRYPLSRLKQIRRTLGPRDWSALFQQSPTAEDGEFFKKTSIRYFHETAPPDLDIYVAGDLSISKKESADWSVFVVAGLDKNDNIYLLDERRGRWDADEIVSEMFSLQDAWNPRAFGVEHGAIWEAIKPHFDKRVREERRYACQVEDLHVKGRDKELRARPIQGRMAQGKVLFPDNALWVQEFVNELLRFPNGVNDDRVDAVAWIGQMLLTKTYQGDLAQRRQTQKSWKEKLKDYIQGSASKERTYMAA